MRRWRHGLVGAALLASGCAGLADPFGRPGTWSPRGANEANLRAMIVNPADLERGEGDPRGRGRQAANAIERVEDDTVKPLPDVRTSPRVGGPSSTGGAGAPR
jgi:hypothetical protein